MCYEGIMVNIKENQNLETLASLQLRRVREIQETLRTCESNWSRVQSTFYQVGVLTV